MLYLRPRCPSMPALFVGQMMQRALLVQSHERPVYDALYAMPNLHDVDRLVSTNHTKNVRDMERVGAYVQRMCDTTSDSLDYMRESLGLTWLSATWVFSQ